MTRKLTSDQIVAVCSRYQAGEPSPSIAASLGVSQVAIRGLLRRRGIAIRPRSHAGRRYAVNEAFFDEIATETQAYWLGFLAADAALTGRNEVSLTLAVSDKTHLEKFRADLGSTHPIRVYAYEGRSCCRLGVRSARLWASLGRHSVTAKKTFTIRWPNLSHVILRHFARGYVDGDGSFSGASEKRPANVEFSATSNHDFILALQTFLMDACDLERTALDKRHSETEIYTVRYSGREQLRRIHRVLYLDASVCLERKRVKLLSLL